MRAACPVHVHLCGTCLSISVYVWMNVSWHAHVHAKMNATRAVQYQQCVTDVNDSRLHIRSFHGNSVNTTKSQQQNQQHSNNNKKSESNEQGGAGGSCINH